MRLVRRDEVQPAPPAVARVAPDPYRVLFPVGIAAALAGLVPWILVAMRLPIPYPGAAHAALMVQGFELAFVCGFLLTAMPAFTHGPRCSPTELGAVTALVGAHVVLRALDVPAAAWAFLAALGALGLVLARRVRPGEAAPPEEFLLVGTGVALGLAGAVVEVMVSLGRLPEAAERAGVRCISLGMLPALVLGLGGLLVPTFARMSNPLTIAGIAKAGDRPRRRAFVVTVAALLVLAVNLDYTGFVVPAAWCRALAAIASTQLAWKLWRPPGRRDRLSWSIWSAGWALTLGFVAAAIWPLHRVEAWHVAFVGGYVLLTLGIGTRVVVSHGGHAMSEEGSVLSWWAVAALAAAALVRALGPTFDPQRTTLHQAVAATLAVLALGGWFLAAWPRLRHTRPRLLTLEGKG
jgi:uncharacterized protein involved in response to NO